MPKVSVIGICGNSIFMTVDSFHESGQTVVAKDTFEEIGGKGINQAVAAARMGADVSFLAAIGDDADGQKCRQTAAENGIEGHFAVKQGMRTTFAFILTDKNGENRVTEYVGAELTVADVLAFENQIAKSDILLLQHEVPAEVNETAIAVATKHGVKVILNPAPIREINTSLADEIFTVTPNEHERQGILGLKFQNCITTLGKDGCSINDTEFIRALPVEAVDTTGAGDTFNGVLAVCLAEGMDMKTACRYAVTASGISVTKHCVLASIPKRSEIERMIAL